MIDFTLTHEQVALGAMAADVAEEVYAPVILQWDRDGTFLPDTERQGLAGLGMLGIALPEEYGGSGGDLLDALLVVEELAKRNQIAAFQVFESNTGPARVIDLFGTPAQRARLLPPIIAGEVTLAVSISEPDAGSAATDMSLTAGLDGEAYVLRRWRSARPAWTVPRPMRSNATSSDGRSSSSRQSRQPWPT